MQENLIDSPFSVMIIESLLTCSDLVRDIMDTGPVLLFRNLSRYVYRSLYFGIAR